MGDPNHAAPDFMTQVSRLARVARRDVLIRRCLAGFFFGLLVALLTAVAAGSVDLPVPTLPLSAAEALAGLVAGALSALLFRPKAMRLLLLADAVLGSRELASTALELSTSESRDAVGFARAVVEDATRLLAETNPRAILGRLRLPLVPFIAVAALCTAGALVFPVNLRSLFASPANKGSGMGQIGEDLRARGEMLAEAAKGQGLDRSIELSRELAQLGADLEARKVTPKDAVERMAQIESGLSQEYELRKQELESAKPGVPGPGAGKAGQGEDDVTRDLADTLDRLRKAQRELNGQSGDEAQGGQGHGDQGEADQGKGSPGGHAQGDQAHGGQGQGKEGQGQGQEGQDKGRVGAGPGNENGPDRSGESGIGTLPAPQKRGPASSIARGDAGPSLQAQGEAANEDSTRLLARSLPEWTGSRLPEEAILKQYSRQVESALARDQIPLKLRQSVKEYFMTIGVTK